LTTFLRAQKQWQVTPSAYGIETAFVAVFDSGRAGPVVSFNAEYDALKGMPQVHYDFKPVLRVRAETAPYIARQCAGQGYDDTGYDIDYGVVHMRLGLAKHDLS
jgi:hypothetical protein